MSVPQQWLNPQRNGVSGTGDMDVTHRTGLNPPLLRLFAPQPPMKYIPPPERKPYKVRCTARRRCCEGLRARGPGAAAAGRSSPVSRWGRACAREGRALRADWPAGFPTRSSSIAQTQGSTQSRALRDVGGNYPRASLARSCP